MFDKPALALTGPAYACVQILADAISRAGAVEPDAIRDAIAATDLDYIEAFTPAPDTDMTLAEARKAWPDKVLWLNYPSSLHLKSDARVEQVERMLADHGLRYRRQYDRDQFDEDMPLGHVLEQSPGAGSLMKRGAAVEGHHPPQRLPHCR